MIPFIVTAAGRFALPILTKELAKQGAKNFAKTYGKETFTAISGLGIGGATYKGLEYIGGIHGPKTQAERETEELLKKPETFPEEQPADTISALPPSMPPPPQEDVDTGLPVPVQEKKIDPGYVTPETPDTSILTQQAEKPIEKPKFGVLTKTELQTALALKEDKPDFYSRAVDAIKTAKDDKYTKGKWASIIKSNTTRDEMDYLGLTELLFGNEVISKQELLKLVEKKDIAPDIIVRSVPEEERNPMYAAYSLGRGQEGTSEDIVFQIDYETPKWRYDPEDPPPPETLFKSAHFNTEYGTATFAHARVQVGYADMPELDNTQIIDEIQSDWLQRLRTDGAYEDYTIGYGEDLTDNQKSAVVESFRLPEQPKYWLDSFPEEMKDRYFIFNKEGELPSFARAATWDTFEDTQRVLQKYAAPDFPIKESKRWVELVLNEMIRKAVKDGRDSIAITNGQIQYNRYEAQSEENKQGNKKFYDEIVIPQLEKIAKKWMGPNFYLQRINITTKGDFEFQGSLSIDQKIKKATDNNYKLQRITLQELWDRTKDEDIPGHAALYTNEGRGQGLNYIENYIKGLAGDDIQQFGTYDSLWNKIRKNEVYVWKEAEEDYALPEDPEGIEPPAEIVWEMPIVPVNDISDISADDMTNYSNYLKEWKDPKGEHETQGGTEQLIKMELPKNLQKEILANSIKLTSIDKTKSLPIDDQTQQLLA